MITALEIAALLALLAYFTRDIFFGPIHWLDKLMARFDDTDLLIASTAMYRIIYPASRTARATAKKKLGKYRRAYGCYYVPEKDWATYYGEFHNGPRHVTAWITGR